VARTLRDLEQLRAEGFCRGIENYSRHLSQRAPGEPPACLLDYFPADEWLLLVDESHITVSQLRAMHAADRRRKATLVQHGYRLPSALDNRPLTEAEFWERVPRCVFVSATPGRFEAERVRPEHVVPLVQRPTGILDPLVEVRPRSGQVDNLLAEVYTRIAREERCLVVTLTKKMSEELSGVLNTHGIRSQWLHSGVKPMQRVQILNDLRDGRVDVLVGVNLLREGLDLPEVSLVAVLDADKEGFLRSSTSLIQTIGRAARHVSGMAILYADKVTDSMRAAMDETRRRRELQQAHNTAHGVVPTPIVKKTANVLLDAIQQEAGGAGGSGATRPRGPPPDLTNQQLRVYNAVYAWRSSEAANQRRRPFKILQARTMAELAKNLPRTPEELRAIFGIGPVKAERYGELLLRLTAGAAASGDADETE